MPAGSLLALLDDVASVLDDVALLTKAATRKTAGVLGDDLALNAQQVAGVLELEVLEAVLAVDALGGAVVEGQPLAQVERQVRPDLGVLAHAHILRVIAADPVEGPFISARPAARRALTAICWGQRTQ